MASSDDRTRNAPEGDQVAGLDVAVDDARRLLAQAPEKSSYLFDLEESGPATLDAAEALPRPDDDLLFRGVAWSPDGRRIAGYVTPREHRRRPSASILEGSSVLLDVRLTRDQRTIFLTEHAREADLWALA